MHMRGIIATSDFKIEIAYIRSLDPSDIFQFSVATTEMSSTETGASLCIQREPPYNEQKLFVRYTEPSKNQHFHYFLHNHCTNARYKNSYRNI